MFKLVFIAIFLTAFLLRSLYVSQGAISFHYDMARDAFVSQQIWKDGNLKIIGPPTTIDGLYSGVFYYYLLSLPYGVSHGDPKSAAIFLSLLNSLAILPIFLLAKDIFKSRKWALLSILLYAISFEAIQYGPWLSNPSPALFTIAWFFYFLRSWQKGKKWGLFLTCLFAAISAQFEFFLMFLLVVILFFKFIFKIKVNLKQFLLSAAIVGITLSTYIIAMIKFHTFNQAINGFLMILQNTEFNFRIKFTDLFLNFINRFSDLFINNFFPTNVFIGGLLGLATLFILITKAFGEDRKNIDKNSYRFILFCLLCNLLIFIFGGQNATYTTVGIVVPAILGICVLLQSVLKKSTTFGVCIIVLMILSSLYMSFKLLPMGQLALVLPKDMVLKNQLRLIDLTYEKAKGEPFSINTLTLPLWTNTTWAYLYNWYGKSKYGYLPKFYGHDQVGLLGAEVLEKIDQPSDITFFIIEPHIGIPDNIYQLEIGSEDSKSETIEQFKWGDLILQERRPIENEE